MWLRRRGRGDPPRIGKIGGLFRTTAGVDMTPAMLECVAASAKEMAELSIELKEGDAEELPVGDESVDVVISNGVISLTTDKTRAFSEIARMLVPGGRLMLGDIVVKDELSEDIRNDVDLWAA